jgi:hypothetical protein
MNSSAKTISRMSPIGYHPRLGAVKSAIPTGISRDQLHRLLTRYENLGDPAIAALPTWYRAAASARIHELLTQTATGRVA